MRLTLLTIIFIGTILTSYAGGTEAPTLELGKTLFQSPALGSSGKSCSTCHPRGKGLEDVKSWKTSLLVEQVNECIHNALKGESLGAESTEMNSLILYLRSF